MPSRTYLSIGWHRFTLKEKIIMTNKFTDPIHYLDATALAELIRTGQLSSREVVQAHLDRISAVNPKINAVVTLTAENALEAADAADKAVASGAKLGPLHGSPLHGEGLH